MRRWNLAALLLLVFVALATFGAFEAVAPPPAPRGLPQRPAVTQRIAKRLLFVVVDGLRWDIAIDPELMPAFSAALKQHTSAQILAGRVTMTTAAVLTYGTGQPGGLEEFLRNTSAQQTVADSWLAEAARQHLRVIAVGDPAWSQIYGPSLADNYPDPEGVAIDVDFNKQTFRDVRRALGQHPDAMIAHFVTPDHQGHAYGILSPRYRAHIQQFDQLLSAWLAELSADTTVIVTSDHGAADSGTHGTDVPVQRRSPLYAYGPGIVTGLHPTLPLAQAELPGFFAALLGLPGPRHARRLTLVDWLDLQSPDRAAIACEDVERAAAYATATLTEAQRTPITGAQLACKDTPSAESRILAAKQALTHLDQELERVQGLNSPLAQAAVVTTMILALLCALLFYGSSALVALPLALLLAASGLLLTLHTERLSGHGPNTLRAVLFVLGNTPLLLLLLRPARVVSWLGSHARWLWALAPGLIVATYTRNTQPQAYIFLAVLALVLLRVSQRRFQPETPEKATRFAPWTEWLFLTALLALLSRPGILEDEFWPNLLQQQPLLGTLAACGSLVWLLTAWRERSWRERPWRAALWLAIPLASLLLRRVAPPLLGRGALLACGVAAILAARREQPALARALGLASYAWISRDLEWLGLTPLLLLASWFGQKLAWLEQADQPASRSASQPPRSAPELGAGWLLLALTAGFCLTFLLRVALHTSIEFTSLDFGAGGFGDPHVPFAIVASCLVWKYLVTGWLLLDALVRPLTLSTRRRMLQGLLTTSAARGAMILAMLYVCGRSYWTAFRVLGDLPFGPLYALAAWLTWTVMYQGKPQAPVARRLPRPCWL